MNWKQLVFFVATFASSIGDALLYFALPLGLGLERNSIQASISLFLIPAISMLLSTLLANKISQRLQSSRKDYSKLLLGEAFLELIIATAILLSDSPNYRYGLILLFVAIYAFAKEGLPKLFYSVAMFRNFFTAQEYNRVVGFNGAIAIAAGFFGTLASGALIHFGTWKWALIIDSATFLALGGTLFFLGKDFNTEESLSGNALPEIELNSIKTKRNISLAVPMIIGIQSLFWTFVPLLSTKLGIGSLSKNVLLMAVFKLPGLILGLFFGKLSQKYSTDSFLTVFPILVFCSSLLFLIHPSEFTFIIIILTGGLVSGLYWPADTLARSRLTGKELIKFNRLVLFWFASAQLVACCMAIIVFTQENYLPLLKAAILIFCGGLLAFHRFYFTKFNRLSSSKWIYK